jgi:hypothetical protein
MANFIDKKTGRFLPSDKFAQDIDHQVVIKMYVEDEMGSAEIARKLNSYPKKIQGILKVNNIPFRRKRCYLSGPDNPRYTGYKEIQGAYWAAAKQGARNRNIEWSITKEYMWDLYLKQDRKCAYSNLPIHFSTNNLDQKLGVGTASIDRIDSSKPYVPGNVCWVHKRVNVMKGNMSLEEFCEFCEAVAYKNKTAIENETWSHSERKCKNG